MTMSNFSRNSGPAAETSYLSPLGGAEELSVPGLFKTMLLSLGNLGHISCAICMCSTYTYYPHTPSAHFSLTQTSVVMGSAIQHGRMIHTHTYT